MKGKEELSLSNFPPNDLKTAENGSVFVRRSTRGADFWVTTGQF